MEELVADPAAAGPNWIQIGTEGGFLPEVAEISPQAIDWDTRTLGSSNIDKHWQQVTPDRAG